MSQCQCLTKDGMGPQCTKRVKAGERFCAIHQKKCARHVGHQMGQHVERQTKQRQERQYQEVRRLSPMAPPKPPRDIPTKAPPKPPRDISVKPGRGCVRQTQQKYVTRPSPPYPANECCGQIMKGNNGAMYKSVPDTRGVCRWKEIK